MGHKENLCHVKSSLSRKEGVKNRTINAILQQIRVILRAAVEWDWLDKCPAIKLLPEPKRRIRWLTESEEMRLMQKLPEHLKTIVQFAILTGLRMSNITQLKWSQIDLPKKLAWVNSDESKTGNSIGNTFICTARTWRMEQNRYCTKICTPIY